MQSLLHGALENRYKGKSLCANISLVRQIPNSLIRREIPYSITERRKEEVPDSTDHNVLGIADCSMASRDIIGEFMWISEHPQSLLRCWMKSNKIEFILCLPSPIAVPRELFWVWPSEIPDARWQQWHLGPGVLYYSWHCIPAHLQFAASWGRPDEPVTLCVCWVDPVALIFQWQEGRFR